MGEVLSDHIILTAGVGLLALALFAWIAERRRFKRRVLDKVGIVPWTTIYLLASFLGILLIGMAIRTGL